MRYVFHDDSSAAVQIFMGQGRVFGCRSCRLATATRRLYIDGLLEGTENCNCRHAFASASQTPVEMFGIVHPY